MRDASFRERLDRLLATDPQDVCGLLKKYEPRHRGTPATTNDPMAAVARAAEAAIAGERPAERRDHAPPWVELAVRDHLVAPANTPATPGWFAMIRALERLGILHLNPDHHYVRAFAAHLHYRNGTDHLSRADLLRADPELMERCFWPMFTGDASARAALTVIDARVREAWRIDILDLVADGTASLNRALDRCLDALGDDLDAAESSWFAGMFAALHPGAQHLADRQARLVDLVGSGIDPTVSFAVTQLVAVEAAGLLDDAVAAHRLGPALRSRTRVTALGGLRLLAAAARRRPDLFPVIAASVRPGLRHPQPDIRERAEALRARVAPHRAPAAAPANPLVDGHQTPLNEGPTAEHHPHPLVHVGSAGTPRSLADRLRFPDLVPPAQHTLRPLDLTELPDLVAELLENATDPAALERALDALVRLDDPALLLGTAARARGLVDRASALGRTLWLETHIARLVLAAMGDPVEPPDTQCPAAGPWAAPALTARETDATQPRPSPFLTGRLDEVGTALRAGFPRPGLLALPTTWPWIAPGALVDRLLDESQQGHRPLHHDLVAALLRLHPQARPQALDRWEAATQAAVVVGADADAVVRYALGGPVDRDLLRAAATRGTRGWWVAASRARTPSDADPELTSAGMAGTGADRPVVAAIHLERRSVDGAQERIVSFDGGPTLAGVRVDEPTVLRTGDEEETRLRSLPVREAWEHGGAFVPWWPWWASVYPHDTERFAADAVLVLARIGVHDWVRRAAGPILDALRDHPGHAGHLSALAVSLGLAWPPADVRARAADALAVLLASARLTPRHLIDAMALAAPSVKTTRWAAALGLVAEARPPLRGSVIDILVGLLPRLDPGSEGMAALVDRLSQEATRANTPVTDPVFIAWADQLSGSSPATQTARLLARGILDPTVA